MNRLRDELVCSTVYLEQAFHKFLMSKRQFYFIPNSKNQSDTNSLENKNKQLQY